MDSLATQTVYEMARRTGTQLTPCHLSVLDFVYNHYKENRVGPLYKNIKRATGVAKAQLDDLFPHGLHSVYTWVGVPIQTPETPCKPMASVQVKDFREVYLDHNATTYVRSEVREKLIAHFNDDTTFGNPSSSTSLGSRAHDVVERARRQISGTLKIEPAQLFFTGCGSESNNQAIKGIAYQHLDGKGHLITTKIEHPSVLHTMEYLETLGFEVTYLGCNSEGRIEPTSVADALRDDTILVSVMAVNNEIGTINPIEEIGTVCGNANVPFMVDAIQAFGKIPLHPQRMGISLMSVSAHKLYGPKGVAALYVDPDVTLVPLLHGGPQERGQRAGTENLASIMAFGYAAKLIHAEREAEHHRLTKLRDDFLRRLREIEPDIIVNGSLEHRIPHNLNIGFPGIDSGSLLLSLNQIGVYVSSGSACQAGSVEASHVMKALGVDTRRYGTIRFSFGLRTTSDDLDYLFTYLGSILAQLEVDKSERTMSG